MKKLTQDQGSTICGYSRPSIGHIENGRITFELSRINHIVNSYGHEQSVFENLMKEKILRDEVLTDSLSRMELLPEEELRLVQMS
jgi:predicted transcriptional regulator